MKASEAFNENGMMCRNAYGAHGILIFDDSVWLCITSPMCSTTWKSTVGELEGNWTRIGNIRDLGLVTNLDDLPRVLHYYPVTNVPKRHNGFMGPHPAVLVSDLAGRCLTRSEGEGDKWQQEKAGLISRLQHARRKNRNYRKCVKDLNRSVEKNSVLSQLQAHRIIQRGNWVNEEREKVKQLQKDRDTLTAKVEELKSIISQCVYASGHVDGYTFEIDKAADCVAANVAGMKSEVRGLTARVAELEGELETVTTRMSDQQRELNKQAAELATLRAQCVLGEDLTEQTWKYVLDRESVAFHDGQRWTIDKKINIGGPSQCNKNRYFKINLPAAPPVLPAPEPEVPVPEVPKWEYKIPKWIDLSQVLGCVTWNCCHEKAFGVVTGITEYMQVMRVNGAGASLYSFQPHNAKLYRKPVRHPDGTIAPIEPSPSLIAACQRRRSER